MPSLFDPIRLGALQAHNRILMAPLTRGRATADHVPTPMMAEYYGQRASAGLIISEATGISLQGLGWPYAPGLWTDEQTEGWKPVTDAVHAKGGLMVAQLWHMGRINHSSLPGRGQPVSASTTTAPGEAHTYEGKKPYEQARALRVDEIPAILDDYRRAARNALAAGFDGVQVHAANGYLIDQFLRDGTNKRDDEYGGSVENRLRLMREVVAAVIEVVGAERTCVRLSPNGDVQGCNDSDPQSLFPAAAKALADLQVAWLELREPRHDSSFRAAEFPPIAPAMREQFTNPMVLNSDYTPEAAQATVERGDADAITFGRPFLANPDLPRRIADSLPLNKDNMKTWYSRGPEGYTDYPFAPA